MSEFYAHSADGETTPSHNWQLLRCHLKQVAALAKQLAAATGVPDLPAAAAAAGWLHDLGKYQLGWQSYLLASAAKLSPKSVQHSIYGAAYAFTELQHCPLAVAIAGHHTGLKDWDSERNRIELGKDAPLNVVTALAATAMGECPEYPTAVAPPDCEDSESGMRRLEYWTRVLFSTLIDADTPPFECQGCTIAGPDHPDASLVRAVHLRGYLVRKVERLEGKTVRVFGTVRVTDYPRMALVGETVEARSVIKIEDATLAR